MALGRLPSNVRIVDANGLPTPEFLRNWNSLLAKTGGSAQNGPSAPTGLTYSFEPGGIRLTCDNNPIAENIVGYQWRIGTDWDTAVVLIPLGASSVVIPISLSTLGTATVWVAASDAAGNYSTPSSMSVTITAADLGVSGPVVNLTAERPAFAVLKNGGGTTPATIVITATSFNLPTPTYAWKVDGVLQVGQVGSTFTISAFSGGSKQVRCDVSSGGVSAFDIFTVYSLIEGDDALIAGLSNENQSISVDAGGTVTAGLPAASLMLVVRGTTILSSGVVFSLVSNVGCTASINSSTGVIAVTAISADSATATFRATVTATSTVIDKVLTLNKSYPGATGATGATGSTGATGTRGSLKGYGSQYGISSVAWSDLKANRVIENMLTGAVLTTDLASTANLRIGDTVQLTDSSSFVQSKFWSGSAWTAAATVIEGNLLVNGSGTFTGNITGASNLTISGQASFDGTTTNSGATYAGVFNNSAASTNGVLGIATAGKAFLGITSTGVGGLGETTSTGIGLHGLNVGNGVGVRAESNPALVPGTALQVVGRMTISDATLVANLNADLLDGNDSTAFATAGHNHTGVYLPIAGTAADSSSLGGFVAAQWVRQTGNTAGNPGTAFTHTLNCVTGAGVTFRIPVFVP